MTEPDDNVYSLIISKAEGSVSETVKKAKNELKNTLSDPSAAFLVPFDSIEFSVSDGHAVLKYNDETITLRSNENYPDTCKVLSVLGKESLDGNILVDWGIREVEVIPAMPRVDVIIIRGRRIKILEDAPLIHRIAIAQ